MARGGRGGMILLMKQAPKDGEMIKFQPVLDGKNGSVIGKPATLYKHLRSVKFGKNLVGIFEGDDGREFKIEIQLPLNKIN